MEEVQLILRNCDAICFDVDSTVIRDEGIDELAKFAGKGSEVASITANAMGGSMTYQDALSVRLNIIKPSLTMVRDFIRTCPPTLTPGIKKLVDVLHTTGRSTYLVSGGFLSLITPVAKQLHIPLENVYANRLKFYFNGDYAGFDENQPTSRTGGKAVVAQHLKDTYGYKNLIFIGDGVTDLESSPPADAFIGYGGNVIRPAVQTKAKWFVTDFNEICDVLLAN
ncbi:phosphoserine phosphatase [Cylas formicarius]|uniref:phosphoserine phosphatase n=1 Tax=Cylas formicarius TaxID=197179 RepID=UPI00295883E6|nr:phosphoserine phosphatase [Cylas formicarius]